MPKVKGTKRNSYLKIDIAREREAFGNKGMYLKGSDLMRLLNTFHTCEGKIKMEEVFR